MVSWTRAPINYIFFSFSSAQNSKIRGICVLIIAVVTPSQCSVSDATLILVLTHMHGNTFAFNDQHLVVGGKLVVSHAGSSLEYREQRSLARRCNLERNYDSSLRRQRIHQICHSTAQETCCCDPDYPERWFLKLGGNSLINPWSITIVCSISHSLTKLENSHCRHNV